MKSNIFSVLLVLLLALSHSSQADTLGGYISQAQGMIDAGNMAAETNAAWEKFKKTGDRKAFGVLLSNAMKNDYSAMNYVGWTLDNGFGGVTKDSGKAIKYFAAASAHNPVAAYNAGLLLYVGRGVPQNKIEAIKYLEFASKNGFSIADSWLVYHYYNEGKKDTAFKYAKGISSFDRLGAYYAGRILVESKNYVEATTHLEFATELSSADGAALLAWLYEYRLGKKTSPEKAVELGYQYRIIERAIRTNMSPTAVDTTPIPPGISETSKQNARGFAANWINTHQKEELIDYRTTFAVKPTSRKVTNAL